MPGGIVPTAISQPKCSSGSSESLRLPMLRSTAAMIRSQSRQKKVSSADRRAEMKDDDEGDETGVVRVALLPLVPAEKRGHEHAMPEAGDRKEFERAL